MNFIAQLSRFSMHYLFYILLSLFFLPNNLLSQNMGKVAFVIKPNNSFIKIENKVFDLRKYPNGLMTEITEGKQAFQIWSPTMKLFSDTIQIIADSTIYYRKGLNQISDEFNNYRIQKTEYFKYQLVNQGLLAVDAGLTIAYLLQLRKKKRVADGEKESINIRRETYQNSITPADIEKYKGLYNLSVSRFEEAEKNYNKTLYIGAGSLLLSYGITAAIIHLRKKKGKQKPMFNSRNPFFDEDISFDVNFNSFENDFNTQLSLKIKF